MAASCTTSMSGSPCRRTSTMAGKRGTSYVGLKRTLGLGGALPEQTRSFRPLLVSTLCCIDPRSSGRGIASDSHTDEQSKLFSHRGEGWLETLEEKELRMLDTHMRCLEKALEQYSEAQVQKSTAPAKPKPSLSATTNDLQPSGPTGKAENTEDDEDEQHTNWHLEIGPLLNSLGINKDPHAFVQDTISFATGLNLLACATALYCCQEFVHLDSGAALRCTVGLALGFVSRPILQIEYLCWPLYEALIASVLPSSGVELSSHRQQVDDAMTDTSLLLFFLLALPQALLHWQAGDAAQLVLPMFAGWVLSDLLFITAFLIKIRLR